MAVRRSIPVGKYLGIKVYLHYSWFLIFLLLTWALSTGFFPMRFPGQSNTGYWVLGIISALLLFVSVLLHELSHSYIAMKRGMKVERITLFFFGGMAGMHEHRMSPKTEFQMAIAGPVMSLLISMTSLIVYNLTSFFYVAAIASYLYRINLILAVFNLVPGFPMDGGRVLRSIVWYWTKDYKRATQIASTGGKTVAYILIFLGFISTFAGNLGGIWFAMIGIFLLLLSTISYEQVVIKDALTGIKAAQFAEHNFASISPDLPVKDAILKHFMKKDEQSYLVIEGGRLYGIVKDSDVQSKQKKEWSHLRISDIMLPESKIPRISSTTSAYTALLKMLKAGLNILPVTEGKKPVGIIRREDLLRYVRFQTTKEKFEKMGFEIK